MGEIFLKEVRFDKYCSTCKHKEKKHISNAGVWVNGKWTGVDTDDAACHICLGVGMREGTEVPLKWEESNEKENQENR